MKKLVLCLLALCLIATMLISCSDNVQKLDDHLTALCMSDAFYVTKESGKMYASHFENKGFTFEGDILLVYEAESEYDDEECVILVFEKTSDAKQMEEDAEDILGEEFDKFLCKRNGNIVIYGESKPVKKVADY